MTNKKPEATTEIQLAGQDEQVIIDLLNEQFGCLEGGEVRTIFEADKEVWNEEELQELFEVDRTEAPYAYVVRKADRQRGSVMFLNNPRFYFSFNPTPEEADES